MDQYRLEQHYYYNFFNTNSCIILAYLGYKIWKIQFNQKNKIEQEQKEKEFQHQLKVEYNQNKLKVYAQFIPYLYFFRTYLQNAFNEDLMRYQVIKFSSEIPKKLLF
mgnify:FL=1